MANELQLPPWLQGRAATASRLQQQLASIPSGNVPHISTRGGRFRLVDAAGNEKPLDTLHLDLVVFDGNPNVSKLYYDKPFDPSASEYAPPTCFSDNGIGASSQAARPQALDCHTCQFNQWGSETSRLSGKPTKACNDILKLAAYVPQQPGIAFLLRIPPASIKGWRSYMQTVKGHGVEVSQIVTRLGFDEKQPMVLTFTPQGWIDQATAETIDQIVLSKSTDTLVGATDVVYSGQPASSTAVQARPEPAQVAPPPRPAEAFVTGLQATPASQFAPGQLNPPVDKAPPKPRGRPRKEPEPQAAPPTQAPFMSRQHDLDGGIVTLGGAGFNVAPAPAQQEAEEVEIPAFLRRSQPAAQAPAPQTHGMVDAPPPDSALQDMLAGVFNLDTSLPGGR